MMLVLVLFFFYIGYIVLVVNSGECGSVSCVIVIYGLVGVINLLIIKYSVEWWNILY